MVKRFEKYYGYSLEKIQEKLGISLNQNAKNFYANLTKAILGFELKQEIEEFQKAGVVVKTVRLSKEDLPKEHISFSAFSYKELVVQEWETSTLKKTLEQKFLFIFLKYDENKSLKLEKIKFWNMPYSDIESVKGIWEETKNIVKNGNIVKEIKINKNGKAIRLTNFPKKNFNSIIHVRPHAQNSDDTYLLPCTRQIYTIYKLHKTLFLVKCPVY